jgi:hypothetical protein
MRQKRIKSSSAVHGMYMKRTDLTFWFSFLGLLHREAALICSGYSITGRS